MQLLKLAILVLYFVVIAAVGIYANRRTRTVDAFAVGERAIGPWKSAMSYVATNFSAGLFVGFAGMAGWHYGVGVTVLALVGSTFIATWLPWKVLAGKAREASEHFDVLTIPAYLEKRYQSSNIRTFSAIVMFIFFVPYAASLLMGLGYMVGAVFGISYLTVTILMWAIVALYVILGGYIAVTLVDMVQGSIMVAVAALVALLVFNRPEVGGLAGAINALGTISPDLVFPRSSATWIGIVILMFATGLGPWGMPDMTVRFYGCVKEGVNKARWLSTAFTIVIALSAYGVGATGRLFFDTVPVSNGVPTTDLIVPGIISQLGPIVGALFAVLLLSASMSTLAGIILSASTSVGIDIVKGKFRTELSEKATVTLLRVLSLVFLTAALVIALDPPDVMMNLITLTVGAVSGSFLAPFLCGLWSKKVNKTGAWAGMLTGLCIAVLGFLFLQVGAGLVSQPVYALLKSWGMPFFAVLAMLIPLAVVPSVSRWTSQKLRLEADVAREPLALRADAEDLS